MRRGGEIGVKIESPGEVRNKAITNFVIESTKSLWHRILTKVREGMVKDFEGKGKNTNRLVSNWRTQQLKIVSNPCQKRVD